MILPLLLLFACRAETPPGEWNEKVDAFGRHLETAMREDFPERIDAAYDYQGLSRLVIRNAKVKDVNLMRVVARATQKDKFIGQSIRRILLELGAEFQYIRQYFEEGYYHLVFKISSPAGIFNYLDFTIEQDPESGEFRIIDVYNFLDGIASSDLYADILKMIDDPGITNEEVLAAMQSLKQMDDLLYSGRSEEALAIFNSLSILFRQRALFLKRKIKILTFFSDREALQNAVGEYETIYPQDHKFLYFIRTYLTDDPQEKMKWLEGLRAYLGEEKVVAI